MNLIDGANDAYAKGKLDRIDLHFQKLQLDPHEVILVGDTLHDWHASQFINCKAYPAIKVTLTINDYVRQMLQY